MTASQYRALNLHEQSRSFVEQDPEEPHRSYRFHELPLALVTRLQAYRQASDYAYAFDIDGGDAANEIASARAFVDRAAAAVAVAQAPGTQ
jgi:hypothetical protein